MEPVSPHNIVAENVVFVVVYCREASSCCSFLLLGFVVVHAKVVVVHAKVVVVHAKVVVERVLFQRQARSLNNRRVDTDPCPTMQH